MSFCCDTAHYYDRELNTCEPLADQEAPKLEWRDEDDIPVKVSVVFHSVIN